VTRLVVPVGAAYRGDELQLDVVAIGPGETIRVEPPTGNEAVAVLVEGAVRWLGTDAQRSSVFARRASAVYVPPAAGVDVEALGATTIALVSTTAGGMVAGAGACPVVVTPDDVTVEHRGEPGWQRDVHDIVAGAVPAQRLLVGETFNEPGQWSSFPPHKHDGRDGEPALEEVYYYRFDRPEGFGFQGIYERGGNERAVFLRDGAAVGFSAGFHPVCAAPGYRLYYLWALAGAERRLAMFEDPAHRWLHGRA
jgi:5-deoxy-glucuronate isomerase